jgi:hypothetical protein
MLRPISFLQPPPRLERAGITWGMPMDLDPSALTLNTLKEAARAEHLAIVNADLDSLGRAMTAGEVLLQIISRKLIGHGQKKALFEETCGSPRVAQMYIQLAKGRALIEANAKRVSHLSIREALKLLRQHDREALRLLQQQNGTEPPPEKKKKAAIAIKNWLMMDSTEQTKLLDDIGRERLCKALSPALAAEIAKHILGQHNQLTGGRKKSAADKQIGALAALAT